MRPLSIFSKEWPVSWILMSNIIEYKPLTSPQIEKVPSLSTYVYFISIWSRGIRTWSKEQKPLFFEWYPNLGPMSPALTPLINFHVVVSRIYTKNGAIPYLFPSIHNWAIMMMWLANKPRSPGQNLVAIRDGVWMINSSVASSKVAVVIRLAMSDPCPSSVYAYDPRTLIFFTRGIHFFACSSVVKFWRAMVNMF